jgi:hypothetical protein|tara:strand:- start:109 stop:255 length:147 start_codon:yes stop_codon:yes gene_type:complete
MRSFPRNPKKVEEGVEICQRCKIALVRIEKDGCDKSECPMCNVEQDGS